MALERRREDDQPLEEDLREPHPEGDPAEEEFFVLEEDEEPGDLPDEVGLRAAQGEADAEGWELIEEPEAASAEGPLPEPAAESDLEEFLFGGEQPPASERSAFGVELPAFDEQGGADPDSDGADLEPAGAGWDARSASGTLLQGPADFELEELELLEESQGRESGEELLEPEAQPGLAGEARVDESLFEGLEAQTPEEGGSPLLLAPSQDEAALSEGPSPTFDTIQAAPEPPATGAGPDAHSIAPWLLSEDQLQESPEGELVAAGPCLSADERHDHGSPELRLQPLEEQAEELLEDEIYGETEEQADRPAPTFEQLYGLVGPAPADGGQPRLEASESIAVDATSMARPQAPERLRSRRLWLWGSLAASVLLAAGAGLFFLPELLKEMASRKRASLAELGARVPTPRPVLSDEVAPPTLEPHVAVPERPLLPDPPPPEAPTVPEPQPLPVARPTEPTPPVPGEPPAPPETEPEPPVALPERPIEPEPAPPVVVEPPPGAVAQVPQLPLPVPAAPPAAAGAAPPKPGAAGGLDLASLAWGTQVLAQLHNGNFFVGRVGKVGADSFELRLKGGEVVFAFHELQQVLCLNSELARRISERPEGYVVLKNANRIQGQIVVEGARFVTVEVREARITIPRESIARVEKGRETSLHFGEQGTLGMDLGLTEPLPEPVPDPGLPEESAPLPVPSGAAALLEKALRLGKEGDPEKPVVVRPAEAGSEAPPGPEERVEPQAGEAPAPVR